jgi:hypothetical protein
MTYRLVVKGPFSLAAAQCARYCRRIHGGQSSGRHEVTFTVDADASQLALWFGEHTHCEAGALLFYGPATLGSQTQPFARQYA